MFKVVASTFCAAAGVGASYLLYSILKDQEGFVHGTKNVVITYKLHIISFFITGFVALLTANMMENKDFEKESTRLNCSTRLSSKDYDKTKEAQTKRAVEELMSSAAYKKYMDDKLNGRLKEVELAESDKIVLSDESDAEDINEINSKK